MVAAGVSHHAGGGARGRAHGRPAVRGRAGAALGGRGSSRREHRGIGPWHERRAAQHAIHRAQGEGRRVRPPARGAGRASRRGRRVPRRGHRRARAREARHHLARPFGRVALPPHLPGPRRRRRGAARMRARGRPAGAGRMGRPGARGRRLRRCGLRRRRCGGGGCCGGVRSGAGPHARALGLLRVGAIQSRHLERAHRPGRRPLRGGAGRGMRLRRARRAGVRASRPRRRALRGPVGVLAGHRAGARARQARGCGRP